MTEDTAAAGPQPPYTHRSLAELVAGVAASDLALTLASLAVPGSSGPLRGDLIQEATVLVRNAEEWLRLVAVVERESGSSWEEIADSLEIDAEEARRRFSPYAEQWRRALAGDPTTTTMHGINGLTQVPAYPLPYAAEHPDQVAAELDAFVASLGVYQAEQHSVSARLARMTPDQELAALSDRGHAISQAWILPPHHLMIVHHEQVAAVWDRIAAADGNDRRRNSVREALHRAAQSREAAAHHRELQQRGQSISPTMSASQHRRHHDTARPAARYGPMALAGYPDRPGWKWCFQCPAWIPDTITDPITIKANPGPASTEENPR